MFYSFLKFLDTELPSSDDLLVQRHKPSYIEVPAEKLSKTSFLAESRANFMPSSEEPRTFSEKVGKRLYDHGMLQKERHKREAKEAESRRRVDEIQDLRDKPEILPISREIAKELSRGNVITENEKWLSEKAARIDLKRKERLEKEIEENKKFSGKKWSDRKKPSAQKSQDQYSSVTSNELQVSQSHSFISYLS